MWGIVEIVGPFLAETIRALIFRVAPKKGHHLDSPPDRGGREDLARGSCIVRWDLPLSEKYKAIPTWEPLMVQSTSHTGSLAISTRSRFRVVGLSGLGCRI